MEWADCVTPFGDSAASRDCLIAGQVSLQRESVLGRNDGGDCVPLSLFDDLEPSYPPAWGKPLDSLLAQCPEYDWGSSRFPIIFCSSNFGVGNLVALRRNKAAEHQALGTPQRSVDWIADRFKWGPARQIISHACVSAQLGLNLAHQWVQSSDVERVLVMSFDFLSPFVAGGFNALKILNGEMPQPFTNREIGSIGLGEGVAAAVIGRDEGDWVMTNPVTFNEMEHMTANASDGAGFSSLLSQFDSEIPSDRIWIKGHGTGTLDAGRLEAESIQKFFPDSPLISWKGSLGHTLGSCALVELAIALRAMESGTIPGTVGAGQSLMTDTVADEPFSSQSKDGFISLSNAFGGAHAGCLIHHA